MAQPTGTVAAIWQGTTPVWAIQVPVGEHWCTQTPAGDVTNYAHPLWLITQQADDLQWVVPISELTFP